MRGERGTTVTGCSCESALDKVTGSGSGSGADEEVIVELRLSVWTAESSGAVSRSGGSRGGLLGARGEREQDDGE